MKKVHVLVILTFLLLILSSCASQEEVTFQGEEISREGVNNPTSTQDGKLSDKFVSLEREVNVLLNDGNLIGKEHYDSLKTRLEELRSSSYEESKLKELEERIFALNPDNNDSADFRETKRIINALYEDKLVIGDDRYQDFRNSLDRFEKNGIDLGDLRAKLEKLIPKEDIKPKGSQNPAVAKDLEIISKLPDCNNQKFTAFPIDLSEVKYGISPLGNINPPGHTLPTPHMYLHIQGQGESTRTVPLKAPGEVYILDVSSSFDEMGKIDEYSIGFALCKDVYGYFKHVKGLSEELKKELDNTSCEQMTQNPGGGCNKRPFFKVNPGTVIGEVGHKQGNFDFGAYDYRIKLNYINPSSYGDLSAEGFGRPRLLSVVCPLDLYDEPMKAEIYSKVNGNNNPKCGNVMQDIPGTIQGSWFYNGGRADLEWDKHLTFGYDNEEPSKAIIAISGVIGDPLRWVFTPSNSGENNRKFEDVKNDGKIYCYDSGGSGRLILQLVSDTELKIEYQSGSCGGRLSFSKPFVYAR